MQRRRVLAQTSGAPRNAIRKGVIPVAGAGTRLFPATKSQPKEMLPVGRKPVVQYVVEELQAAGITQILFITGRKKTAIEDHFDADPAMAGRWRALDDAADSSAVIDGWPGIFYTRQREPTGVADAVACAKDFVGQEPFVVAFGDTIISSADLLGRMLAAHVRGGAGCTVAVEAVDPEDAYRYGIVQPVDASGDEFQIAGIVEKPPAGQAPSNLAVAARYVFGPSIFEAIELTRPGQAGERWLTDSIAILIRQEIPVLGVRLLPTEKRFDIGNFDSYFRAFIEFALNDPRYGAGVRQSLRRLVQGF